MNRKKTVDEACEYCVFRRDNTDLTPLEAYFKDNRFSNHMRRIQMLAKYARHSKTADLKEIHRYMDNVIDITEQMFAELKIDKKEINFDDDETK